MAVEAVTIADLGDQEGAILRGNIAKFPRAYRFANDSLSFISTGIVGYMAIQVS